MSANFMKIVYFKNWSTGGALQPHKSALSKITHKQSEVIHEHFILSWLYTDGPCLFVSVHMQLYGVFGKTCTRAPVAQLYYQGAIQRTCILNV